MSVLDTFRHRHDRWADHEQRVAIVWSFRQAVIGAGLALAVDTPIAGTGYRTPEVTNVELGPPLRMTVKMLEGQVPAQLARIGHLIAPHLGGRALRVVDRGFGWALVTVLRDDPLDGVLELGPAHGTCVVIGRDEGGLELAVDDPVDLPHVLAQGQTRAGKSVWLYGLLAQLARQPRVRVAGVDPSGITLRPFAGTAHAHLQSTGLADLARVERVLVALVADMDARLALMPRDRDILPITDEHPLTVIVLEEYPGLLRALDAADTKQGRRVRSLVSRLLAESHKVGFRLILAAQTRIGE